MTNIPMTEILRALVIDDEPAVRRMFCTVLGRCDWEHAEASTAEEALEILARESFDALIIDKNLPGMDGIELVRRVRQGDDRVVCVIVTGYANLESATEGLNLGIDAYVTKPVPNLVEIAHHIRLLVERRRSLSTASHKPSPSSRVLIVSTDADTCARLAGFLGEHLGPVDVIIPDPDVVATIVARELSLLILDASTISPSAVDIVRAVRGAATPPACAVMTTPTTPLADVFKYIDLGVQALIERPVDERKLGAALRKILLDLR